MFNLLQDIYLIKRVSGAYQEVPASQFGFFVGDALGGVSLGQLNSGYSVGVSILGGCKNRASGSFSVIGGGEENRVSNDYGRSIIAGGAVNSIYSEQSQILGGTYNSIDPNTKGGTIIGGVSNRASGEGQIGGHAPVSAGGTIIAGCVNCAFNGGLIINSVLATARGGSTILGSYASVASGASNVIFGGTSMSIFANSNCNSILNGEQIRINKSQYSLIGGGLVNCLMNANSSNIIGGNTHSICSGANSIILNGRGNLIKGNGDWCQMWEFNDGGYATRPTTSGFWRNIDFPETGTTTRVWDYQVTDGHFSTIDNGWGNTACAALSTIHNGYNNLLSGAFYSTILNGVSNTIQGFYSTVLNGRENFVQQNAHYSLAGGRKSRVLANHSGAMILSDSTDRFKDSVAANTLTLDFSNGVWFKSNINPESVPDSLIRASGSFV